MTHLACWAVPVHDGYVLRADASTTRAVRGAQARHPRHWTWQVAVLHPGDPTFSAELVRRPATLAIEYAWLNAPDRGAPRAAAIWQPAGHPWTTLGLGVVLLAVSGGHWAPALAGAWLLAGRRWLTGVLGVTQERDQPSYGLQRPVAVTADPHSGLAGLAALLNGSEAEPAVYARVESAARALGLADVAAVYAPLARGDRLHTLARDTGLWIPAQALHDPALLPPEPEEPEPAEPIEDSEDSAPGPDSDSEDLA